MVLCYICLFDETTESCAICEKMFCSTGHLNLHMAGDTCMPVEICDHPLYGRHLVANKDIAAGDLVVSEECLVWGPNHLSDLFCLECLIPLSEQTCCKDCGFPLCQQHLETHPIHQDECNVFQENNFKLSSTVRENEPESIYPLIAPLRCLRLMNKPDAWRLISNLMDHREERLAEYDIYIDPYKQTVIDKVVEELKVGTDENIIKVLGYLDVNSIAVRGLDGVYRGRGIYPIASLMNHSCICNTRNIINHTKLETRATVSIKRGECITTHYVSPLLAVNNRREKLKERWFFECSCPRCSSSTDLLAFTSGVKCTTCTNYQVPLYPLQFKSQYRCLGCQEEISCDNVNKLVASLEPLVQALNVFQMPGTETEERLMSNLEEKLHPTHELVLDIKINLARKLGRTTGLLRSAEKSVVKNKIKLCIETLGVMKIVYPGLSKYRGLLLYELADSLVLIHTWIQDKQISSIQRETDPSQIVEPVSNSIPGDTDPSQILDIPWIFVSVVELLNLDISPTTSQGADWIEKCKYLSLVVIEESLGCLRFERDVSYEGDIYRNLINIKNTLKREN